MTATTKKFFIGCLFALVLMFGVAIVTRTSYYGATTLEQLSESGELDDYLLEQYDDAPDENSISIHNMDDLKAATDCIVKVKVTNDRQLRANSILTKVQVEAVLQTSDDISAGEEIFIYEPASFNQDFQIYEEKVGYQLMKVGEEYIVFLNYLKVIDGYQMSQKEKRTYYPSTSLYSTYRLSELNADVLDSERVYGDGERYAYREIKDMDLLTIHQEELELYRTLREQVLKW